LHAAAFEELLIEQRRVTSGNVSATVPLSVESLAIVT
jgi:hypothetical protein